MAFPKGQTVETGSEPILSSDTTSQKHKHGKFQWPGNSQAVTMILTAVFIYSLYPLMVERWGPASPVALTAGVVTGRGLVVGAYWVARWGDRAEAARLWTSLWCPSGVLHVVSGLNQLCYVAALSTAVPAAVVFLGEAQAVVVTYVMWRIYARLGRTDRNSPHVSRSRWLLLLAVVGVALVVMSQGTGYYQIRWVGVALALGQALLVTVKICSQLWWGATRSRENETSGVLFLGAASELTLATVLIPVAWLWGVFIPATFLLGMVVGCFVQATGYILQRTANVVSTTPNINVLLLALPLMGSTWLWLFSGPTHAHLGLLVVGGAFLAIAGVALNIARTN